MNSSSRSSLPVDLPLHFTSRIPPRPEALAGVWPRPEVLTAVETDVGHAFADRDLLGAALLHRSASSEAGAGEWAEAQRLEFLGDAVLGLLSADWLLAHAPSDTREGALTKMRSRLTNTEAFAEVARRIGLDRAVVLGRGEDLTGGRSRASLLADTLEAVFGAIWLDGGWPAAATAFDHLFVEEREVALRAGTDVNPKGAAQELALRRWGVAPTYALVDCSGPAHARRFLVEAHLAIPGAEGEVRELSARAEATSKQAAEVAAATILLRVMRAEKRKS